MLLEKLKKSKLYIGIALVIQCFAFVIAALISFGKRREESGALLAVAAISGAIGTYLIAIDTLDDEDVYGDFSNHFDDFDFDFLNEQKPNRRTNRERTKRKCKN